jgi:XRE family aerobic/anaerobic benzoate catabolism transcriptional regulator
MSASSSARRPRALRLASSKADNSLFLLGKRVREMRNRRGMTRKSVARDARVSERHLAQLESGEGNISVLLLRRIAAALHVSLAELFSPDVEETAEKHLIQRFLARLPAHHAESVLRRLTEDFAPLENLRRNRIALIGLRGAGKSTLGSKLASAMELPFIELDHEIEKEAGMPLSEIFSLYGQPGYRTIAKRTLQRVILENDRAILSVGGGAVSEKETYDLLLSSCYTVWIKAQPEEHLSRVVAQGDLRAMAAGDQAMEDLRRILQAREPLYRKADLCVDTSDISIGESFLKLQAGLEENLA